MIDLKTGKQFIDSRVTDVSTPIFVPSQSERVDKLHDMSLTFTENSENYQPEEVDDVIIRWYPIRIRYGNTKRVFTLENRLNAMGYTTFTHQSRLREENKAWEDDHAKYKIHNLLFIRAMKIQIKALKRYDSFCSSMQFMPKFRIDRSQPKEIIWIPERQMENFIDVSTRLDPYRQRIPLTYSDFLDKQGKRVRILHGPFKNIEGEVKRINRQRIVVTLLRDAKVAIGITCIPPENLELIDNT